MLTMGNPLTALSKVKGRTSAPGPDGIVYAMLAQMPESIARRMLVIMQRRTQGDHDLTYPWDMAQVTFVAKRARPSTAVHWRPITVANHLKKVYELTLFAGAEE